MPEDHPRTGLLRAWRDKRHAKRERTGPSAEAEHERRNADKVYDPNAVGKNAAKTLGPPGLP